MKITVFGRPAPQGSMVRGKFGGVHSASKSLATWREAVRHEAAEVRGDTIHGPADVSLSFSVPKPKSAKAGAAPIKRPDLDKLCRAVFDALTDAGVWDDDSQVVSLMARKLYAGDEGALDQPGVEIIVLPVNQAKITAERPDLDRAKHIRKIREARKALPQWARQVSTDMDEAELWNHTHGHVLSETP